MIRMIASSVTGPITGYKFSLIISRCNCFKAAVLSAWVTFRSSIMSELIFHEEWAWDFLQGVSGNRDQVDLWDLEELELWENFIEIKNNVVSFSRVVNRTSKMSKMLECTISENRQDLLNYTFEALIWISFQLDY